MSRPKEDFIIEDLEILDAGSEGKSIGRYNDIVVFVGFAVPGDIVDVKVISKKRKYYEARIINIKQKSPKRTEPVCKHFGTCGGCKWQSMDYQWQLEYKHKQVIDNFVRIGKLKVSDIPSVIPSDSIYFYRNKLEYAFSDRRWLLPEELNNDNISQSAGLGFHIPKIFDKVIDIEECFLQKEPSNEIRNAMRQYCLENNISFYNARKWEGLMRNIIIRNTLEQQLMVIVVFGYKSSQIEPLMEFLSNSFPQITSLNYVINTKKNDTISDLEVILFKGSPYIEEKMENLTFRISPISFFQTNSQQAYKLYSIAREFANLSGNEVVYDLYTGTGTIANFISKQCKKVVGIEYVETAIEDAKINSTINNISNTQFFAGDIAKIFTDEFINQNGKPEVIITDPPRAGMHPKVIEQLLKIEPDRIVYVSCNPATQARDIALLENKYTISKIQPVDMFPQTHHIENVVCLTLKI